MQYTIARKSQSLIWWLSPSQGTAWNGVVYMPSRWYSLPDPDRTAWLRHEEVHLAQGIDLWRYLTSRGYRRSVEEPAYEAQVRYLVAHGSRIDIENWSAVMTDYGVMGWIERDEAREVLRGWIM